MDLNLDGEAIKLMNINAPQKKLKKAGLLNAVLFLHVIPKVVDRKGKSQYKLMSMYSNFKIKRRKFEFQRSVLDK